MKVYLETSFVSYLTGRPTTRKPVASWQAASRRGQVFWGYNDAGELAPLPMEAVCGASV